MSITIQHIAMIKILIHNNHNYIGKLKKKQNQIHKPVNSEKLWRFPSKHYSFHNSLLIIKNQFEKPEGFSNDLIDSVILNTNDFSIYIMKRI